MMRWPDVEGYCINTINLRPGSQVHDVFARHGSFPKPYRNYFVAVFREHLGSQVSIATRVGGRTEYYGPFRRMCHTW